ncbi:MAG: AAA family ATPase [Caldimicrobium sp.]|nr:AAA family ATPase [Caldimicrobium sp.]MCX7873615.1 AAA family ATPase [Caldimicrobium sp.]MDW8094419.1 AAA family ATPase [Caldimicrobium sp.]
MLKASRPRIERVNLTQKTHFLLDFSLRPADLEAYLDEYLIGQSEAKGIICTKICTHFHKAKALLTKEPRNDSVGFVKNNIIIIGPSGVGKTYTIKLIAKKLGVPFVKGDATKFSETGYVGGDVEDLVRDLYWEAEGDIEKARFGIIYLDEIDKIASPGDVIGPDVSRTGVQRALLKPLEETEVEIKTPQEGFQLLEYSMEEGRPKKKKLTLNTKYILFVVSGAFNGLEEIIKKRLKKQKLGFLSEIESKENLKVNYLKFVTPEDLVTYGFEREFVGRFPVIAVFDPLTEKELYEILANPNSVIVLNKKRDFKVYNIDLAFTNEALEEIAKRAYLEGTGARALARVLERSLIPYERVLPSVPIKALGVTRELIMDPEGYLKGLLANPNSSTYRKAYEKALIEEKKRMIKYIEGRANINNEIPFSLTPKRLHLLFEMYKREDVELIHALEDLISLYRQIKAYETTFSRRNQIQVSFAEETIDYIMEEVLKRDQGVFSFCEKTLSKLEYTFSILKEAGVRSFYIEKEAFTDQDRFLTKLLQT